MSRIGADVVTWAIRNKTWVEHYHTILPKPGFQAGYRAYTQAFKISSAHPETFQKFQVHLSILGNIVRTCVAMALILRKPF